MRSRRVYLAGPCDQEHREDMTDLVQKLYRIIPETDTIYCPWEVKIPNAWKISNDKLGHGVFCVDVHELDECDYVVVANYGREATTAGTAWEMGYAFANEKPVILVNMSDDITNSLMVANGSWASVSINNLKAYDWVTLKPGIFTEHPLYQT